MKHRDLVKALEKLGYKLSRDYGDHEIFKKEGCREVQVPRHREVNEDTARAILKKAGQK